MPNQRKIDQRGRRAVEYAEPVALLAAVSLVGIGLLGAVGVLVFMAFGGILAVISWRTNIKALGRFSYLLPFPLVAILSTLWSDAPQATMRAGLQLLLTFIISILICANLPARKLVLALGIGSFAMCISALPNVPATLATGQPLTSSLLGSKNQLGFAAFILVASALAILVDRQQRPWFRLAGLCAIPIALAFAFYSRSGGATVSILITLLLFPPLAALTLLGQRGRLALTSLAALTFGFALLFRENVEAAISEFRSDVLEKNATLSGRTYLWEFADHLWRERPMLGRGYEAFWRHGNLDAEALWRWGGIGARSGFNFHNVIVETKVALGVVGLTLLLVTCAIVVVAAAWKQIRDPSMPRAFLLSTLLVLYLRSTIENGLVAEFSLQPLILLATGVYSLGTFAPNLSLLSAHRRAHGVAAPAAKPLQ